MAGESKFVARIVIHRRECDEWLRIATGVVYIKQDGGWRETTKAEMDVLELQIKKADNQVSYEDLNIGIDLPQSTRGEEGSYYVLLYPLMPDGKKWDGEVWTA